MFRWITKDVIIAVSVVSTIAIVTLVVRWVFASPFSVVESPSKDDIEQVIGASIMSNSVDFARWYKTNIVMQVVAIICGIGATVVASLTNSQNASVMKYITISLTTVTSLIIAFQSTFNIKDNLATYIQVHTDLNNIQTAYIYGRDKAKLSPDDLEKLKLETQKQLIVFQQIRWRTYAKIGQAQNLKIADPEGAAREVEVRKTVP